MPSEDSEQGDMYAKLSDRASSCSTSVSFSPNFEDCFYIGSQEKADNLVVVQLTEETLTFEHKRCKKSVTLSLTTIEESMYLRDERMVFAIKLKSSHQIVTLSTFQKSRFIRLYLHLANYCLLTGFEKHYRVGKQIGAGTFGVVYDGFNVISHENVALKVISKSKVSETPHGLHMLHNEIRILQKLRKQHISPLISTYETVDCFILVLEKGAGGHLFDYIQSYSTNYGEKMLKSIFKQLLEILKILHNAGFIHRDIKPENIICKDSSNPSIFLCDYSISIRKSEVLHEKKNNLFAGTIGYVAPQIINEQNFDQKIDIFSVGCMFFYLFTGQKLFATRDIEELEEMTEDDKYITQRLAAMKNLKEEARDLLSKLLAFDPKKRPSASEALDHSFFRSCEMFVPNLGEYDDTLAEFLERKISHFFH